MNFQKSRLCRTPINGRLCEAIVICRRIWLVTRLRKESCALDHAAECDSDVHDRDTDDSDTDSCKNQESFAGWLLLVKTAVIRVFFGEQIPRMKNQWLVLGIFMWKMPRVLWKSYQEIIGESSFLVNRSFERSDITAILPNMMMLWPDFGNCRQCDSPFPYIKKLRCWDRSFVEPLAGIEPATCTLRMCCSARWATVANLKINNSILLCIKSNVK